MSWPTVAIKEVARVVGGATPKTGVAEYWDGHIPWATPRDLSVLAGKHISDTPRKISATGLRGCAAEVLPANSVLFSSRAPIGHVAINQVPMATNQGFKSFIPGKRLDPSFLYWWLDASRKELQALGTGATFKEVSKATVERIRIPLPPLEEQKRIAAILDEADALRRLRRRALECLKTLGPAIFHEMFGDPIANTRQLPFSRVGDVIQGFESGKNIAEDPDGGRLGAVRVLKVSAVTSGIFKFSESKALPASYTPPKSHFIHQGDLLFSRANTEQLIGATAVVVDLYTNLVLPDKLWRVTWRCPSPVEPTYMHGLFSSSPFREEIRKRSTGTSGSMKNISQEKVLSIQFGLPELDQQRQYNARLTAVSNIARTVTKAASKSETIFTSLQHRAFRGEL